MRHYWRIAWALVTLGMLLFFGYHMIVAAYEREFIEAIFWLMCMWIVSDDL